MKKINNEFNEDIYRFQTDSGLDVIYLHREGFKKSTGVLAVPFGAIHLNQSLDGKQVNHPSGIAHFLEHKLFEDEGIDVFQIFTDLGASSNAFTSYDYTMYYFTQNHKLLESLDVLLKFVRQFSISNASVEKEKPIIVEEIKMYEQMPDMKLLMETYRNVFHTYPFIYDIAGTKESVNASTLDDLDTAFALNYHDSRLLLVVIGPEDPMLIKELVDKHPQNSTSELGVVENIGVNEPLTVVHKERHIEGDIAMEKMSYAFKFAYEGQDKMKDQFLIRRILDMNFSELNPDYQKWLDDDIITDFFSYDVDLRENFGVVYFFNQSDKQEEFKSLIFKMMNNLIIDADLFEQIMKRSYGEIILSLSQFDRLAFSIAQAEFNNQDYFESVANLRRLTLDDVLTIKSVLQDFDDSFLLMKGQA
ncbi:EF-P 5-aminopentanol modification-associated protein YfmH [Erysipelothrix urinaevulpis]|uniref:EF-P 5-aminopentanol modification-associated protein YfmH n=1 Tax=Erysipelothrix urinaevulpis TaxID=2683717 RepID=UPI00135C2A4C|nr:pitrilysin family protein [Erysipelothrix urinaevulpis]